MTPDLAPQAHTADRWGDLAFSAKAEFIKRLTPAHGRCNEKDSPLHVERIVRLNWTSIRNVLEYLADLFGNAERNRPTPVKLGIIPV